MGFDNPRSAALYTESLTREEHLWQLRESEGVPPAAYWGGIVRETVIVLPLQDLLWEPSVKRGAALALAWLENADPSLVKERLPQIADDGELLGTLDAGQRHRFVSVWREKGDPTGLQVFLESRGGEWEK